MTANAWFTLAFVCTVIAVALIAVAWGDAKAEDWGAVILLAIVAVGLVVLAAGAVGIGLLLRV